MNLDKPLTSRTTSDGKEVISLEDFLSKSLRHPSNESETLIGNATAIMKWLGIPGIAQSEAKRANKWFRANGFRAVHKGMVYRVALVDTPEMPYHVV